MGVLIVVGIILLIIGIILFFVQRYQRQKSMSIRLARSGSVAELQQLSKEIAAEIGPGNWREYVKLTGQIHCDRPLTAELTQEPCVYYTMRVTREYEETIRKQDNEGKSYQETRRGSDTLSSNERSMPFELTDSTGQIRVNPDGAAFDTVKVLDEFRQGEPDTATVKFGNVSFKLNHSPGRRTLGYRYTESILPVDQQALVVGMISDQTGDLILQRPFERSKKFLISLKSEAELLKQTNRSLKLAYYFMVACFGIGAILLILGMIR